MPITASRYGAAVRAHLGTGPAPSAASIVPAARSASSPAASSTRSGAGEVAGGQPDEQPAVGPAQLVRRWTAAQRLGQRGRGRPDQVEIRVLELVPVARMPGEVVGECGAATEHPDQPVRDHRGRSRSACAQRRASRSPAAVISRASERTARSGSAAWPSSATRSLVRRRRSSRGRESPRRRRRSPAGPGGRARVSRSGRTRHGAERRTEPRSREPLGQRAPGGPQLGLGRGDLSRRRGDGRRVGVRRLAVGSALAPQEAKTSGETSGWNCTPQASGPKRAAWTVPSGATASTGRRPAASVVTMSSFHCTARAPGSTTRSSGSAWPASREPDRRQARVRGPAGLRLTVPPRATAASW